MNDKFIALWMLIAIAIMALAFALGCKPSIPQRADYPADMYPCYLADVCVRMPAFAEKNSAECGLAIQKCFRYTDYKKCVDEKNPDDCFSKLGIRI